MTPAAAPAKFTFDRDLGRSEDNARLVTDERLDDIARSAREEGYQHGLADGEATASARAAQGLTAAAERLVTQIVEMNRAFDAAQDETLRDAVRLAAGIGHKLAGTLVAREPAPEIEALLEECIASLRQCPHVVIRCHPDLGDAVRAHADERLKTAGFSGRLVVMGEPDIALGDARIEWAEGGITRDMDAISAQIDTQIAAYLAARGHEQAEGSAHD